MIERRIAYGLLVLVLLCVLGCGESSGRVGISGSVTYDGEPVEKGTISFVPTDGQGVPTGGVIENGRYSTDVVPGEMIVQIRGERSVKKENPTAEEVERGLTESKEFYIPAKYNSQSELKLTIAPGDAGKDFDLEP